LIHKSYARSDLRFAPTVRLGVTEIEATDAKAVAAIRAGRTRVVGKRTPPKFFIGNTVQSICRIVKKRVIVKKLIWPNNSSLNLS